MWEMDQEVVCYENQVRQTRKGIVPGISSWESVASSYYIAQGWRGPSETYEGRQRLVRVRLIDRAGWRFVVNDLPVSAIDQLRILEEVRYQEVMLLPVGDSRRREAIRIGDAVEAGIVEIVEVGDWE